MGTGFDFVDGIERRGSLRISEKYYKLKDNTSNKGKYKIQDNQIYEKNNSTNTNKSKSHWTHEEKKMLLEYLPSYGKNWEYLSQLITTKTPSQIKNYFQNYRTKLKLDLYLPSNKHPKS